ncbi:MAG: hypothetical protein HKN72_11015 [Gemmatimonadetes bacterium]|nr:hypothetical protein [Gemmatimonadota bacterium]
MIRQLFTDLEEERIAYAVWKGSGGLADALAGKKDIDLLVGQRDGVPALLGHLGFRRFASQPWVADPHVEDWIGIDSDSGALVHLHLYYELVAGRRFVEEYHLPWKETLLSGAQRHREFDIDVCDPDLEILLLGIRIAFATAPTPVALLGRSRATASLGAKLSELRGRVDEASVRNYAEQLLGQGVGQEYAMIVVRGDTREPEVLSRLRAITLRSLSPHRRFGRIKATHMQLSRGCRALVARAKRRIGVFSQTKKRMEGAGAIIAIIGSDGAGKSTVTRELVRWLRWKVDAHMVYLGSGDGRVGLPVRVLKSLASRTKPSKRGVASHGTKRASEDRLRRRPLVKELGSCLLALAIGNERLRKVRKAHRARRKGSVLITDRFPQRQYPGIYDGPKLDSADGGSALRRYFAKLEEQIYREIEAQPPDLVVRLRVPASVALHRKPDHSEAEIRRKAELTGQIEFPGATVLDVDASAPLEDVLRSVKTVVWNSI